MEIQEFNLRKLLNNEYLALGREFEALIQEKKPDTLKVTQDFGIYRDALQAFDDSVMKVTKSAFTAGMKEADKHRDEIHVGIIDQMYMAQRHFDPAVKAAGLHMEPLVSTYRKAQTRSFDDQTGATINFLQELQSDKYKDDVEKIGLATWITELKKANDQCASLTMGRTSEKTVQTQKGTTADTRPVCDKAYVALVKRINALALLEGDAVYAELIVYWNGRLDHYRVVISNRLGAGKGESTGGGDNKPKPGNPPDENPDDL